MSTVTFTRPAPVRMPRFAPVGLTLTAGGGSRWWEASVGVTNLFDAGYESPVGPEHLQDSVAQDGRSIRVALTTRF